ncbi:methyltransferase domain-containing protein [Pseudomonas petrae]|uniref:Methyltransferase domain-containing protein n=1 Tax=Pseudomonas petrae TaxID=2912190 RepID=A0ABS9ICY3_9PSED|nr:methyltransferase domain-containing protein [Pseudomonas petrae]MCF7545249.1 methyltransferase domain-containing protein [Pseudomonas petrae]
MVARFYRAFEDRHRGSRELILERLQAYMPFLGPFLKLENGPVAIDLGCGRGEWLEMVIGAGFTARGVDLDEGMLEGCRTRGLPADLGDAVGALKARAAESASVISAFHLVEHIPFPALQDLVNEALRVLKPGGLLILETPNAENLFVGSNGFYMDPTHERPIPHLLLSFLTEFSGFERSKLLRLQEEARLHDPATPVDLITALGSSSPDYAIVAQKKADDSVMSLFDEPFAQTFGITPGELAARYDQSIEARFQAVGTQMAELTSTSEKFLETIAQITAELGDTKYKNGYLEYHNGLLTSRNEALEQQNFALVEEHLTVSDENKKLIAEHADLEAVIQDLRSVVQNLQDGTHHLQAQLDGIAQDRHSMAANLNAVVQSTSWRITHPLRKLSSLVSRSKPVSRKASKKRTLALKAINFVSARPFLKPYARTGIKFLPASLRAKLWALSVHAVAPVATGQATPANSSSLSLREAEIYMELKQAFERKESK